MNFNLINDLNNLNNKNLNRNKTKLIVETIINNKNFNNNMMLLPLDMNFINDLNMLLNELRHIRPEELERIIKKIVKEVLRDPKFNIHKAKKIARKIESISTSVIPSVIPPQISVSGPDTTEISIGGILTKIDLALPGTALVPSTATTMSQELDKAIVLFSGKPSMDPEIGNALALLQKHTLSLPQTDTKARELELKNIGMMVQQLMVLDMKRTKDTTFLTSKFQIKFPKVSDVVDIMKKMSVFLNPLNLKLPGTESSSLVSMSAKTGQMILYHNGKQITLSRAEIKSSTEITRALAAAHVVGGPLTTQLEKMTGYDPKQLAMVLKNGVTVEAKKMFHSIGLRNLASTVRKNMPNGIDMKAQINIMGATILRELLPFLVNKDIKNAAGLAHFSFRDLLIEAGVSLSNTTILLQFIESNSNMLGLEDKSVRPSAVSQETLPVDENSVTTFIQMLIVLVNHLQVNNPTTEQQPLQLTSMQDLLLLQDKTPSSITPFSPASSSLSSSINMDEVVENYGAVAMFAQAAAKVVEETHKMELGGEYDEIKENVMVNWDELPSELKNIVQLKQEITSLFDNHRTETENDTFNRTNKNFPKLARLLMQLKSKVTRVYNFFKVKNLEAITTITDLSDTPAKPLESSDKKDSILVQIKEHNKKIIKTINELIEIHKGERIIKPINTTQPSILSRFASFIGFGSSDKKPKETLTYFNDPLENVWRHPNNLNAISNFITKSDIVFNNQESLIRFTKKYNVDYNKKYLTYKQKYLKLKEAIKNN